MPWRMESVSEQRLRFVIKAIREDANIAGLCREFGISRPTGYLWLKRYREEGPEGLEDRSRCPQNLREETPANVIEEIVKIRNRHDDWGGRTIKAYLVRHKLLPWVPHPRTIDRILKRCGFVTPLRHGKRVLCGKEELVEPQKCNDVWTVDHKGWWLMQNKQRVNPLTIRDLYTRFILDIGAAEDTSFAATKERFVRVFEEYGLPDYIRSDNGTPFASTHNPWGLSRLSVWWLKLGIIPNRTTPATPSENGGHERMHRDMARKLQKNPGKNLRGEQRRFDSFRYEFNEIRPHQALNMKIPAEVYRPSKRRYPPTEPTIEYPADFERRLVTRGQFSWAGRTIRFSKAFAGETVGIEFVDAKRVRIWYTDLCLGSCDKDFKEPIQPCYRWGSHGAEGLKV